MEMKANKEINERIKKDITRIYSFTLHEVLINKTFSKYFSS